MQHQTCLVQAPDGSGKPIVRHSHHIEELNEPHQVLVQITAVALNPTDYKMPEYHPTPNAVMGCDFVGDIVKVGSAETNPSPGTRVCGVVAGSNPGTPQRGAFCEYLVADARHLLSLPDSWSDLEGAALGGVGWQTVALSMGDSLRLTGTPSTPAATRKDGSRIPVLVYGGATATGIMACQILTLAGYDPIATCSESSSGLVKEYGASMTESYTSSTCASTLNSYTKGALHYAIDCITTPESVQCCLAAIGRAGGRCATLDYAEEGWRTRKAVKFDMPLAYTATGKELKLRGVFYREADMENFFLVQKWRDEVQSLVDKGLLKCHPFQEITGRWDGILRGLDMLQSGVVRGQKLVVRLRGD